MGGQPGISHNLLAKRFRKSVKNKSFVNFRCNHIARRQQLSTELNRLEEYGGYIKVVGGYVWLQGGSVSHGFFHLSSALVGESRLNSFTLPHAFFL